MYLTLFNSFGNIAVANCALPHYNDKYSVETMSIYIIIRNTQCQNYYNNLSNCFQNGRLL